MHKRIRQHFQTHDPILAAVIPHVPAFTIEKSDTPFRDLVEAIICQQLSDKAGATIFERFSALFVKKSITPASVLRMPDARIRAAGPSWSKVGYIKNIARAHVDGVLDVTAMERMDNEDVIVQLTKIKGIGRWTAEMFLMFTLGREDVFSFGDLGLRRAIQKLYNVRSDPTVQQMTTLSNKWKPYRTYAARILWKSLDVR